MPDQTPTIRSATPDDAARVVSALASAFDDDPVFNWTVRQDGGRLRATRLAMQNSFELLRPLGESFVDDSVCGAALWAPPDRWQLSRFQELLLLPLFVRVCSFSGFGRVMAGFDTIKREHPRTPHRYLFMLGVRRERQGQGLGSALLSPMLQRCDTEGMPAYLENSKAENLPFYRRHGFEVQKTFQFGPKGPPMWGMWRVPRASSTGVA
jgi:GNAT superfamily N-acetyltransferase